METQWQTLKVSERGSVLTAQLHRPEANNTINDQLMSELHLIMQQADKRDDINILVLEGLPEVFCFGADFKGISEQFKGGGAAAQNNFTVKSDYMDNLSRLSQISAVVVAHVRGKVNAGGVGLVSACDLVVADQTAMFSLSELLFGLLPAQVMPFLIRRVGFQKAHRMTLLTQAVDATTAHQWGLIDELADSSKEALRRVLLRCRGLQKPAIKRMKSYMQQMWEISDETKQLAVNTASSLFSDPAILEKISRFVENEELPWQGV